MEEARDGARRAEPPPWGSKQLHPPARPWEGDYAGGSWAWSSPLESDSSPTHGHLVLPGVTRGR